MPFLPNICKLIAAAGLLAATALADTYTVYLPVGADSPELRKLVEKTLPKETPEATVECRYIELPQDCDDMSGAETIAAAMEAGVTHLPCLVAADENGPYATLLLRGLQPKAVIDAVAAAVAPDREEKAEPNRYRARMYRLFARCKYESATEEQLHPLVSECRQLLNHPLCTREQQQLIGLRCLYPLLMKQYAQAYKGAHTPATEAKLLEAIAALEAARDINPDSALGKRAHDERHRLRMARREARKYE
ncbi:MAG: hypothetical protein Q4F38_02525 [Akkermansia sp.]|nr:hypothetical protein [Akkermansia sp.]